MRVHLAVAVGVVLSAFAFGDEQESPVLEQVRSAQQQLIEDGECLSNVTLVVQNGKAAALLGCGFGAPG